MRLRERLLERKLNRQVCGVIAALASKIDERREEYVIQVGRIPRTMTATEHTDIIAARTLELLGGVGLALALFYDQESSEAMSTVARPGLRVGAPFNFEIGNVCESTIVIRSGPPDNVPPTCYN